MSKILNTKQAAKFMGLKESRVRTAVFRKEIPFLKVGRLVRFRKEDLEEWLEKQLENQQKESKLLQKQAQLVCRLNK